MAWFSVKAQGQLYLYFPIQTCLKRGDVLSPQLFNFVLEYAIWKGWNWMEHISPWSMLTMLK
jgi:hypothetical protein